MDVSKNYVRLMKVELDSPRIFRIDFMNNRHNAIQTRSKTLIPEKNNQENNKTHKTIVQRRPSPPQTQDATPLHNLNYGTKELRFEIRSR